MERVIYWAYDEEDYPALVMSVTEAVHRIGQGGTVPVDAQPVPEDISPDLYAVVIADHPLTRQDLADAWRAERED